ncbi:MAG: hypothetical protein HKO57_03180, partial [Akkermansiaceae bacterium]|nr:hypothetical protein [Akkermansiaceae bacterium]
MELESAAEFSFRKTPADLAGLQAALRKTLAAAGPRPAPGDHRRILNLACGRADETGVLADVLGAGSASLELVCSDLRAREIAEARERWDQRGHPAVETRFIAEDATRLFDRHALPEEFDVAFLRHQNFWNGPE